MTVINDLMTSSRSTVADALALVSERAELNDGHIQFKVRSLFEDCGLNVNVVSFLFVSHKGERILVGLPSAQYFRGLNCTTGQFERRSVKELEEATADMDGNLFLSSKHVFRAVEVHRSADLCDPSELDEAIVQFALSSLPNIHEFYGSPFSSLRAFITETMPSQVRLDWAKLNSAAHQGKIRFSPIKVLCHEFFQSTLGLCRKMSDCVAGQWPISFEPPATGTRSLSSILPYFGW